MAQFSCHIVTGMEGDWDEAKMQRQTGVRWVGVTWINKSSRVDYDRVSSTEEIEAFLINVTSVTNNVTDSAWPAMKE